MSRYVELSEPRYLAEWSAGAPAGLACNSCSPELFVLCCLLSSSARASILLNCQGQRQLYRNCLWSNLWSSGE